MALSVTDNGRNIISEEEAKIDFGYRYAFTSEIEEESSSEISHSAPMTSIKEGRESSLFSLDGNDDSVYVAVGKSESSMDALSWTLKHAVNPSTTTVYLVHVYPEIRHIPSPLGKIPKNQVSPEMVEQYMAEERGKMRELLQKFVHECGVFKVKVDTMLIESDMVPKAILELIPVLNIKKLVIGINKSSLRKLRSGKGNGIADQVAQSAMDTCEIKMVCEGKEVVDQKIGSSPAPPVYISNLKSVGLEDTGDGSSSSTVLCGCFHK